MYLDDLKKLINKIEFALQQDKRWNDNEDYLLRQKIKRIAKDSPNPIISYLPIENENINFNKKYWSTNDNNTNKIVKLPDQIINPNMVTPTYATKPIVQIPSMQTTKTFFPVQTTNPNMDKPTYATKPIPNMQTTKPIPNMQTTKPIPSMQKTNPNMDKPTYATKPIVQIPSIQTTKPIPSMQTTKPIVPVQIPDLFNGIENMEKLVDNLRSRINNITK